MPDLSKGPRRQPKGTPPSAGAPPSAPEVILGADAQPGLSTKKPSRPRCQRCSSTRAETMVRTRHLALYKCADCGWRFSLPRP